MPSNSACSFAYLGCVCTDCKKKAIAEITGQSFRGGTTTNAVKGSQKHAQKNAVSCIDMHKSWDGL